MHAVSLEADRVHQAQADRCDGPLRRADAALDECEHLKPARPRAHLCRRASRRYLSPGIPAAHARRQGQSLGRPCLRAQDDAGALGSSAPQAAIAAHDERQAVLVAGPARVLLELDLLLGRLPALAFARPLLDLVGGVANQRELVLDVLLGAETVAGLAGMAGNHPLPIH